MATCLELRETVKSMALPLLPPGLTAETLQLENTEALVGNGRSFLVLIAEEGP
jgi:hypothetical protein